MDTDLGERRRETKRDEERRRETKRDEERHKEAERRRDWEKGHILLPAMLSNVNRTEVKVGEPYCIYFGSKGEIEEIK